MCIITGTDGWEKAKVIIEDCPRSGISCIDFRRAHGLPDDITNEAVLPNFRWQDEEFVRMHANKADACADLNCYYKAGEQTFYEFSMNNGDQALVDKRSRLGSMYGTMPKLSPAVIKAYTEKPCKETGRALFLDLWDYEWRSLCYCAATFDLTTPEGRLRASALVFKGDSDKLARACMWLDARKEGIDLSKQK